MCILLTYMHRIESRKLVVCLVCSTSVIVQMYVRVPTSWLLPLPNNRQEKCKDYRPRSMQQQMDPPPDRSRQMDDGESDIVKRRKSKLFASFKNSFTR